MPVRTDLGDQVSEVVRRIDGAVGRDREAVRGGDRPDATCVIAPVVEVHPLDPAAAEGVAGENARVAPVADQQAPVGLEGERSRPDPAGHRSSGSSAWLPDTPTCRHVPSRGPLRTDGLLHRRSRLRRWRREPTRSDAARGDQACTGRTRRPAQVQLERAPAARAEATPVRARLTEVLSLFGIIDIAYQTWCLDQGVSYNWLSSV